MEDVVLLCERVSDFTAENIRASLTERDIDVEIVFGKRVIWAATPTLIYVKRADLTEAREVAAAYLPASSFSDPRPALLDHHAYLGGMIAALTALILSVFSRAPIWLSILLGVILATLGLLYARSSRRISRTGTSDDASRTEETERTP